MKSFRWLLPLALATGCAPKPSAIEINPRKVVIFGIGASRSLEIKVLDSKRQTMPVDVTLTSSNPAVVEASGTNRLVGKKAGNATATITAGKITATVPVEVRDLAQIEVKPPSLALTGPTGTVARLEVAGKSAAGKPVPALGAAWVSKNPAIASVDTAGVVKSGAPGRTAVQAKIGELLGEAEVTVVIRQVSRIDVRPETLLLRVGETQKLAIQAYDETGLPIPEAAAQLSTPNAAVIRVSADGSVTGLAKGTASVRATLGDHAAMATILVN
jgi:uncharacterized protein YjdB